MAPLPSAPPCTGLIVGLAMLIAVIAAIYTSAGASVGTAIQAGAYQAPPPGVIPLLTKPCDFVSNGID